MAVRGTGLDDDEFEEFDDPPLLLWLFEDDCVDVAIAVEGVEDARLMLLVVEEDEGVLLLVDEV
jgi:hypothetical protein